MRSWVVCFALVMPVSALAASWREGAQGYETAVFDQKQSGQPLLVYFETPWCGYCRDLEKKVLDTAQVKTFLEPFAKVKINPEDGADHEALARKFGVSGYPSVFIVPVGKFPEKVNASGAAGPKAFIASVNRVAGNRPLSTAGGEKPEPKALPAEAAPVSMKVAIPVTLLKDLPADVVAMQAENRHDAVVRTLSSEIKRSDRDGVKPKAAYLYARALSYRALRKHSDAASDLERYLTMQPDDVAARETLARSYLNVTMHADAAVELETLVKSHPTAERKFLLAEAYAKTQRTKEAAPLYQSACSEGHKPACK